MKLIYTLITEFYSYLEIKQCTSRIQKSVPYVVFSLWLNTAYENEQNAVKVRLKGKHVAINRNFRREGLKLVT